MNPLAKRISKMETAVVQQRWNVILDYWEDVLADDPEAAELRKQLDELYEASERKPPVFYLPDSDSETRRWIWFAMTDPQACKILDALASKVDRYVESLGGWYAERKKNHQR